MDFASKSKLRPSGSNITLVGLSDTLCSRTPVSLVMRPNSCLFSGGLKQSERSSNLSLPYFGNNNPASLRPFLHKLLIPALNPTCFFLTSLFHARSSFLLLFKPAATSLKARRCACTTWRTSGGSSWVPTPTETDPTTSGCPSKGGCRTPDLEL